MKRPVWVAIAVAVATVFFGVTQPAAAEPSVVSLDDAKPDLTEKDGSWTTSLGLTNLTDSDVTVTPSTTQEESCTLTLGDSPPGPRATIPAAEHAMVKVNISAGCNADEEDFTFQIAAVGLTKPFTIDPEPAKPKTPEWRHLLVFPFALLLLLAAGLKLVRAKTFPEPHKNEQSPKGSQSVPAGTSHQKAAGDGGKLSLKSKLRQPMSHLADPWRLSGIS